MPKVRILSGNQAGGVVEMDQPAAESAIASGYGEAVAEVVAVPVAVPISTHRRAKKDADEGASE